MKNKITLSVLLSLLQILCAGQASAQVIYTINSADQPFTIFHNKASKNYSPQNIKNQPHPIYKGDSLLTERGSVYITLSTNNGPGSAWLPQNSKINAADVIQNSIFRLDPHDSYYLIAVKLYNRFMHNHETKPNYTKRLRIIGGGKLGVTPDFLNEGEFKNDLRSDDLDTLNIINDSLRMLKISDSTYFHLERAVYLERKKYYGRAYSQYKAAYNSAGENSPVVAEIYRQFLYRVGRYKIE